MLSEILNDTSITLRMCFCTIDVPDDEGKFSGKHAAALIQIEIVQEQESIARVRR